jgi:hypothetical protein
MILLDAGVVWLVELQETRLAAWVVEVVPAHSCCFCAWSWFCHMYMSRVAVLMLP